MADDQPYYGSWFMRIDRFADVHMVAAQNKGQSCALASIKMVYFKMNKLRPGTSSLATEQQLESLYKAKARETVHDFDQAGSNPQVMVDVLNAMAMGNWAIAWPPLTGVGDLIEKYVGVDQFGLGATGINAATRKYPVILACYWQPRGGHAIVVDTVTSVPFMGTYATICDPWDANVHFEKIEKNKPFTYNPKAVSGLNFWGETKADQSGIGGNGVIKAVIYCQKAPGFWG
jgi:hypothetical protein